MPIKARYRFWEVDLVRGIAVIEMIYFHFMWDLSFFRISDVNMLSSGWQNFARSIGSTFIFVMGLSLTLTYNRAIAKGGGDGLFNKFLRRGLKIFAWGMLITVATYFFAGRQFVVFGILHLLGATMILAYPFLGPSMVGLSWGNFGYCGRTIY